MNNALYNYILNKEHHQFRHEVEWDLANEYAAKGLSPIERMVNTRQGCRPLCQNRPYLLFRTNIPYFQKDPLRQGAII